MKNIKIKKAVNGIVLIILLATVKYSKGQNQNSIMLSAPENGIQVNTACQYIKMVPGAIGVPNSGFYYDANILGSYLSANIDNSNMCEVTYLGSGGAGFDTNNPPPLNTNLAVGTINGSFNVDANGGADYGISLVIPPGTMGMAPNLSLNYSSQGGNGLLGTGWSLGGLSAITRTTENYYNDGQTAPVTLTNSDRFLLDGNRLTLVSPASTSVYGLNGTIYHTENETFQQVISHGQANGGPLWFEVDTKDGKRLSFGNTTDSRIMACGSNQVLTWLLDTVTDNRGNYLCIHYIQDGTNCQYYPDYIAYSGNVHSSPVITPYNKITFSYALRGDPKASYVAGFQENQNVLMTGIQMYAQNTLVHHYQLDYTMDALYSHLSEITEYGTDGTSFNSTKINYHNNLSQTQTATIPPFSEGLPAPNGFRQTCTCIKCPCYGLSPAVTLVGDFTGDGRSGVLDEIQSNNTNPYDDPNSTGTNWYTYTGCNTCSGCQNDHFTFCASSSGTFANGSTEYLTYNDLTVNGTPVTVELGNHTAIQPIDMNGDGMDDLVLFGINWTGGNTEQDQFQVSLSNGSAGFSSSVTVFNGYSGPGIAGTYNQTLSPYFLTATGDFDGDGRKDLVVYYPSPPSYASNYGIIYKFSMSSNGAPTTIQYDLKSVLLSTDGNNPLEEYNSIYAIDINGDGRTELLLTTVSYVYILDLNNDGTISIVSINNYPDFGMMSSSSPYALSGYGGLPNVCPAFASVYPGDFNGDGKTDLLIYNNNGGQANNWYIGISNGSNGFTFSPATFMAENGPPYGSSIVNTTSTHSYYVADFNGDGKDDIIDQSYLPSSNTLVASGVTYPAYYEMLCSIYYGNGNVASGVQNAFVQKAFSQNLGSPTAGASIGPANGPAIIGDFDGDGHTDFAMEDGGEIFCFDNNNQPDNGINKAIAISNGLNATTNITYNCLPYMGNHYLSGPSGYTPGTGATFPLQNVSWPIYVTQSIKQDNGNGSQNEVDYSYSGALYHAQGRGFLGFTSQTGYNLSKDLAIQNTYGFTNGYFDHLPLSTSSYSYSTNTPIDTKSYQYTTINNPTNISVATNSPGTYNYDIHYNYLSVDTDNNELSGIKNTTTIQQDLYGNTTQTNSFNSAVSSNSIFSYGTEPLIGWNGQIPACLTYTQSLTYRPSQANYLRYATYTYSSKGQVLSKVDDIGTTTSYTYDDATSNVGNLLSTTVSGSNITTRTNSLTYDSPYRRFVTVQTNPLNQSAHATYDNAYGNVVTTADPNGLITKNSYDGFGRSIQTTTPTGQQINTITAWNLSNTLRNSLYSLKTSQSGTASVITYYDKLNRTLRTQTTGLNGTINVDQTYNSNGQLDSISNPYYAGVNTPLYGTFTYDDFQRSSTIKDATGGVANYSYTYGQSAYTVVATAGSLTKTLSKTFDQSGALSSLTDDAGTLSYAYASCGKPVQVTLPGTSQVETMTYDAYGRQLTVSDPDAGTTTYGYDDLGEITSQVDANGSYSLTYDVLGRVLTRDESNTRETNTFTYDNSPNGVGLISSVADNNGISYSYTYDNYSRLQSKTEVINGNNYIKIYGYDNLNRITQITYPSQFIVYNSYDPASGTMNKITSSDGPIWTSNYVNAYNEITSSTYGNYGGVNKFYDVFGYLTEIKGFEPGSTGPVIMDYGYNYNDVTGNLTSRTDKNLGLSESFTYDNLDRLTNISGPQPTVTMNYDAAGDITYKADVGNYVYNTPNEPHAVSAIQKMPSGNILPTDTQNVQYSAFKKPSVITEGRNTLSYTYGPDQHRKVSNFNNGETTIIYDGDYEEITTANPLPSNTYQVTYIESPDGLVAMDVKQPASNSDAIYWVHKDNVGSIIGVYDMNGNNVANQSFDAWGNYRNPTTWQDVSSSTITQPAWLIRGYTGHEQLPTFGLVNMNARMYDPLIAHVLSPDPYVQNPEFTQNFNRHSYAYNNPFKYKDPTGKFWWVIVGAVVGGGLNVWSNWSIIMKGGSFHLGVAASYFTTGAFAGALTSTGIGGAIGGGVIFMGGSDIITQRQLKPNAPVNWAQVGANAVAGGTIGMATGSLGGPLGDVFESKYGTSVLSKIFARTFAATILNTAAGTATPTVQTFSYNAFQQPAPYTSLGAETLNQIEISTLQGPLTAIGDPAGVNNDNSGGNNSNIQAQQTNTTPETSGVTTDATVNETQTTTTIQDQGPPDGYGSISISGDAMDMTGTLGDTYTVGAGLWSDDQLFSNYNAIMSPLQNPNIFDNPNGNNDNTDNSGDDDNDDGSDDGGSNSPQ